MATRTPMWRIMQHHATSCSLGSTAISVGGMRQAVAVTADLLAEQVAYYRARASEYDAGAYPEGRAAADRIAATVTGLRVTGSVLELACGTGMWTRELARRAAVTAVDSSPETIAIARPRCPPGVRFQVGDVFAAPVTERFDVVFFAFWLSHVPAERFGEFFARVAG